MFRIRYVSGSTLPIHRSVIDQVQLGSNVPPSHEEDKSIFSAILEFKYGKRRPAGYIDTIIGSVTDNPLRIRPPRYQPRIISQPPAPAIRQRIVIPI
jgi:hypothetical protein